LVEVVSHDRSIGLPPTESIYEWLVDVIEPQDCRNKEDCYEQTSCGAETAY
jgi:hypothetical protein